LKALVSKTIKCNIR